MNDAKKYVQALHYPSEVVTLALLIALKGQGNRVFYRWMHDIRPYESGHIWYTLFRQQKTRKSSGETASVYDPQNQKQRTSSVLHNSSCFANGPDLAFCDAKGGRCITFNH